MEYEIFLSFPYSIGIPCYSSALVIKISCLDPCRITLQEQISLNCEAHLQYLSLHATTMIISTPPLTTFLFRFATGKPKPTPQMRNRLTIRSSLLSLARNNDTAHPPPRRQHHMGLRQHKRLRIPRPPTQLAHRPSLPLFIPK